MHIYIHPLVVAVFCAAEFEEFVPFLPPSSLSCTLSRQKCTRTRNLNPLRLCPKYLWTDCFLKDGNMDITSRAFGFEVVTAVTMRVTLCSSAEVHRQFGGI
jgi:hypothetical protein